jgi:hypothetical protein
VEDDVGVSGTRLADVADLRDILLFAARLGLANTLS